MIAFFLAAAALPGILLQEPPADLARLTRIPDLRIYVPAEHIAKWSQSGFKVTPANAVKDYVAVPPPRIRMQTAVGAATAVPWIDHNGWRIDRGQKQLLYSRLPERAAPLAAAEAFAFDADAVIEPAPADVPALLDMLAFLAGVERKPQPVLANIGLVDNGAKQLPEIMNLLARRNLMYRVVNKPDKSLDLNVEIGSREFPLKEAANPYEFAQKIRSKVGDDKRTLRLFNTSTVLARVTGDGSSARVHLINYGNRSVSWVQVRVLGNYKSGQLRAFGLSDASLRDFAVRDGGTEFTVPVLNRYAVVDLVR